MIGANLKRTRDKCLIPRVELPEAETCGSRGLAALLRRNRMGSRPDIERPVVLLVEDDRAIAEMMSDLLDAEGFEVLAVRAGEEAVRLALGGTLIDLVFTDIDLAGKMSGWELGEVLGNMRPDLPIAYTSGGLIID